MNSKQTSFSISSNWLILNDEKAAVIEAVDEADNVSGDALRLFPQDQMAGVLVDNAARMGDRRNQILVCGAQQIIAVAADDEGGGVDGSVLSGGVASYNPMRVSFQTCAGIAAASRTGFRSRTCLQG